jgi:hypothetical protein
MAESTQTHLRRSSFSLILVKVSWQLRARDKFNPFMELYLIRSSQACGHTLNGRASLFAPQGTGCWQSRRRDNDAAATASKKTRPSLFAVWPVSVALIKCDAGRETLEPNCRRKEIKNTLTRTHKSLLSFSRRRRICVLIEPKSKLC